MSMYREGDGGIFMKLDDYDIDEVEVEAKEKKLPKITLDENKKFMAEAIGGIILLLVLIAIAIMLLIRKDEPKEEINYAEVTSQDEAIADELEATEVTEATEAIEEVATPEIEESKAAVDLTKENKTTPVKGELPQRYTPGNMLEYTADDYQLPELFAYWDNYQLDAVNDLIRLERVRTITDALKNSNDYYYYGSLNSKNLPEGKGLAVYAHNTYYFGEWKNGKRDGNGMWIRIFPDEPGILNGIKGVKEHQYSGNWSADYPDGEGQEHVEYDYSQINGEFVILNAIGSFKEGLYNGDMYIMTVNNNGNTIDWYGTAQMGSFSFLSEKKTTLGKRSIWKAGDGYNTDEEDNCRWIMPKDNKDFGIAGLKK